MKKKLILAAGAMIIAAAVSATVYVNRSADRDDLFEQNLDALADGENIHPKDYIECWYVSNYTYNPDLYLEVRDCFSCSSVNASEVSTSDKCMP